MISLALEINVPLLLWYLQVFSCHLHYGSSIGLWKAFGLGIYIFFKFAAKSLQMCHLNDAPHLVTFCILDISLGIYAHLVILWWDNFLDLRIYHFVIIYGWEVTCVFLLLLCSLFILGSHLRQKYILPVC